MKTLNHHTLLYDNDCPLCAGYTQAFIKTCMLDVNGRMVYEKGMICYAGKIDGARARNEIVLIDTKTGNVKYGIESLFYIIASAFPFLTKVLRNRILIAILKKVYAFISFNRKVIATSANYNKQTCTPDFSLFYRLLYIVVVGIFTSVILLKYSHLLTEFVPKSNLFREYIVCFGQIAFQTFLLLFFKITMKKIFDYLGNMMTVSMMGAVLLSPILLLAHFINLSPIISLAYFFMVVIFMFLHHKRRVRNMEAPFWLSYSWVAYRCLVLLFIL